MLLRRHTAFPFHFELQFIDSRIAVNRSYIVYQCRKKKLGDDDRAKMKIIENAKGFARSRCPGR